MNIKQALESLDPENDGHWTTDGLPRVDVVSEIVGHEAKRGEITEAAPEFTRGMVLGADDDSKTDADPESTPDTAPAQAAAPKKRKRKSTLIIDPIEGKTDAERAAMVEIVDDVVTMDAHEVYSDIDLVNRAIAEFARKAGVLAARRESITDELKIIGSRSALLCKVKDRAEAGQSTDLKVNQDYLRSQREIRAKRAVNAGAFLKAGTNAADIARAITGKSLLDAAIGQRNVAKRKQEATG